MNTAARRFPSITNEGAIRPHENAFRRWSSPDFGGSAFGGDFGVNPRSFSPTMPEHAEAVHADTFKVYTPAEVRSVPFRKSAPAYEEAHTTHEASGGVGARTLLKWTGIGIVSGLAVLTALIVVLNFGGDRNLAGVNARSALTGNNTADATLAVPATAPAKLTPTKTDLELTSTPVKKASTAKLGAKKKR